MAVAVVRAPDETAAFYADLLQEVCEENLEDMRPEYRENYLRQRMDHLEALQRAVERGGLPSEEEEQELYKALGEAQHLLEGIAFRVEKIARSDTGSDLPFAISLEHIGIVGVILSDVSGFVDDLQKEALRIRKSVRCLEAIRLEQKARRAA